MNEKLKKKLLEKSYYHNRKVHEINRDINIKSTYYLDKPNKKKNKELFSKLARLHYHKGVGGQYKVKSQNEDFKSKPHKEISKQSYGEAKFAINTMYESWNLDKAQKSKTMPTFDFR